MPSQADLLSATLDALPWAVDAGVLFDPILKGGSDRSYYRLRFPGHLDPPSAILMHYTDQRPDNRRFLAATRTLLALGVSVPQIYAADTSAHLIWLEDLGEADLHSHGHLPWPSRRPLYLDTLKQAARFHSVPETSLSSTELRQMELRFDAELYRWEQDYFAAHCLGQLCGLKPQELESFRASQGLAMLRDQLAQQPRHLVHRDLQSENVLVRDGKAFLIDYQGLRPGLPEYDLASLVFDAYCHLPEDGREELIVAHALARQIDPLCPDFRRRFHYCAAQRLMQALGAFANLALNLDKPCYLDHVGPAAAHLQLVASSCSDLGFLLPFADLVAAAQPHAS